MPAPASWAPEHPLRCGVALAAPLLALLLMALACSGGTDDGLVDPASGTPPKILEIAADWPLPNYDDSSTRATFESTIDSGKVDQLTEVWRYELPRGPGFGAATTTPIAIDGTVYLGDLLTNVHAVDLVTGERRWTAEVGVGVFGPSGVAVGWDKVFANKRGTEVAAYDAETGEELSATNLIGNGGAINIQPTIADGKVVAATSSLAQPGARGILFALDQETGDVLWSIDTIESEDLWGHPELNSGGGAWYPPSVDISKRLSYGFGSFGGTYALATAMPLQYLSCLRSRDSSFSIDTKSSVGIPRVMLTLLLRSTKT